MRRTLLSQSLNVAGLSTTLQSSNGYASDLDFDTDGLHQELTEFDALLTEHDQLSSQFNTINRVLATLQSNDISSETASALSAAFDFPVTGATLQGISDRMKQFWAWLKAQAVKIQDKARKIWDYFFEGYTVLERKLESLKSKIKDDIGHVKETKVNIPAGKWRYFLVNDKEQSISDLTTYLKTGVTKSIDLADISDLTEKGLSALKAGIEGVTKMTENDATTTVKNMIGPELSSGPTIDVSGGKRVLLETLPGNFAYTCPSLSGDAITTKDKALSAINSLRFTFITYPVKYKAPSATKTFATPQPDELRAFVEELHGACDTLKERVGELRKLKSVADVLGTVELKVEGEGNKEFERDLQRVASGMVNMTYTAPTNALMLFNRTMLPAFKAWYDFANTCRSHYAK